MEAGPRECPDQRCTSDDKLGRPVQVLYTTQKNAQITMLKAGAMRDAGHPGRTTTNTRVQHDVAHANAKMRDSSGRNLIWGTTRIQWGERGGPLEPRPG